MKAMSNRSAEYRQGRALAKQCRLWEFDRYGENPYLPRNPPFETNKWPKKARDWHYGFCDGGKFYELAFL